MLQMFIFTFFAIFTSVLASDIDPRFCANGKEFVPNCGNCIYDEQCENFQAAYDLRTNKNQATGAVYCCPNMKKCISREARWGEASCYRPIAGCGFRNDPCSEYRRGNDYPVHCSCPGDRNFPYDWVKNCPTGASAPTGTPEKEQPGPSPTEKSEPETTKKSEPEATKKSEPETTKKSEPETTKKSEPETTKKGEPESSSEPAKTCTSDDNDELNVWALAMKMSSEGEKISCNVLPKAMCTDKTHPEMACAISRYCCSTCGSEAVCINDDAAITQFAQRKQFIGPTDEMKCSHAPPSVCTQSPDPEIKAAFNTYCCELCSNAGVSCGNGVTAADCSGCPKYKRGCQGDCEWKSKETGWKANYYGQCESISDTAWSMAAEEQVPTGFNALHMFALIGLLGVVGVAYKGLKSTDSEYAEV